ncbi:MAG: iron-sulfur cluster insertion protein ErpA [Armatimonadota bacterium]
MAITLEMAEDAAGTACPISLTERAAQEVRDILEQQGNPEGIRLRVYVAGGGCSGLQYGLALDESIDEDDRIYADNGIEVILAPMDVRYLQGAIVDYVTTPMGGGFKVENPNAVKTCGCGSSFSVEDDEQGRTITGGCGSCGSNR